MAERPAVKNGDTNINAALSAYRSHGDCWGIVKTKAAATTAITGAGLTVGAVTQQASSTVASGDVISENPAAGTSVTTAYSVALIISSGAAAAYTIGGTLIGLSASSTVHVISGADSVAISANGSFTLPTALPNGATYSVTVGTPTSAQTCAVQNPSGTITSAKVTSVTVDSSTNALDVTTENGTVPLSSVVSIL